MLKTSIVVNGKVRLLLTVGLLTGAIYVWGIGFEQHNRHLSLLTERLAQPLAVASKPGSPSAVAPAMPATLNLAFWQAQQADPSGAYSIADNGSGLTARNPAQTINSRFSGQGVEINGWQMRLAGIGWEGQTISPVGEVAPAVEGQRIEYRRMGGLTEWYINGPLGLEQGFTLSQNLTE